MYLTGLLVIRRIQDLTFRHCLTNFRRMDTINCERNRSHILFRRRRNSTTLTRHSSSIRSSLSRRQERTRQQLVRRGNLQITRRNAPRNRRLLLTTKGHTDRLTATFLGAQRVIRRRLGVLTRTKLILRTRYTRLRILLRTRTNRRVTTFQRVYRA